MSSRTVNALALSLALAAAATAREARGGEGTSTSTPAAPSPPLGLTAIPASPTQIVLAWVAPPDAAAVAGYEVLQGDEPVLATTGLTASLTGLSPWREYCYTVRARDTARNASAPSKPACARTLDTRPPTTPANVVAKALSESEIEISWAPSTDDGGIAWYEVTRDTRGAFAAVEETRARERLLEPWTRCCYTVRARDLAGNWSEPSAEVCTHTLETVPPSAPPALVARAKGDSEVELAWGDSTDNIGVARYEVSRDGVRFAQGPATHTHQGGLRPAQRYCYEVVAVDEAGNRSQASSACVETPDLTAPTAPGELEAAGASASEIVLEFKPSTDDVGVAGYEVLEEEKVIAKLAMPYGSVASLSPGTEHCYRVRAFDAGGNRSPETGVACARTATDPAAPPAPRRLRAEPVENSIVLEWEPPPAPAATYRVSWERDKAIGSTQNPRFTVAGLKPGEKHCFQVAAIDSRGKVSPRSLSVCAARASATQRGTLSAR